MDINSHLSSENKRLNELVVQIIAECNERLNNARFTEVELYNQLQLLKEERNTLLNENTFLKRNDSPSLSNPIPLQKNSGPKSNEEKQKAREEILHKLQELNEVIDGLATHGSKLHGMVTSFYQKPQLPALLFPPPPSRTLAEALIVPEQPKEEETIAVNEVEEVVEQKEVIVVSAAPSKDSLAEFGILEKLLLPAISLSTTETISLAGYKSVLIMK